MGIWGGRLGLREGCALAGLSSATSFIPEVISQHGCRQSRELEVESCEDGSVQCQALPFP